MSRLPSPLGCPVTSQLYIGFTASLLPLALSWICACAYLFVFTEEGRKEKISGLASIATEKIKDSCHVSLPAN